MQSLSASTMGLVGPQGANASIAPVSPLQASMNELSAACSHLHSDIDVLESKLQPVMSPAPPTSKPETSPTHPIAMVAQAQNLAEVIEFARQRLDSLASRLGI